MRVSNILRAGLPANLHDDPPSHFSSTNPAVQGSSHKEEADRMLRLAESVPAF